MKIAFFGSSLVSAYWNGAATYYRGMIRALYDRGHQTTFYEPDAYERQAHRDLADPEWARVVVYPVVEGQQGGVPADGVPAEGGSRVVCNVWQALEEACGTDLVVKASGVGVFDALLEEAVLGLGGPRTLVAYWDVDAAATLERVLADPGDPFRALIPRYDLILTYGGGDPVVGGYTALGARRCVPIYNALDPHTHYPVPPDLRFGADLGLMANRLPDREERVERFFLDAAASHPHGVYLLGGNGWADKAMPSNVRYVGHVYTADHNAFNCSPRAVLNIARESMARYGFSPASRVFEAAGAGACLISDAWEGLEQFLEPDREVLVAHDGGEVAAYVQALTAERSRAIGAAARRRVLAHHTYAHRAEQFEAVLGIGKGNHRCAS